MTIREILSRCSFDEIMLWIGRIDPRQLKMRPFYREARDILLHTHSKNSYGEIDVTKNHWGDGPWVMMCEGNPWESLIDSELVLEEGVKCTDAQLAAQCLWHLTFYYFVPEEKDRVFAEDESQIMTRRQRVRKLIDEVERVCPADVQNRMNYLFHTRRINVQKYRSRAYDAEQRMAYLIETMTCHLRMPLDDMKQIAFILSADPKQPLTEKEQQMFDSLVTGLLTTQTLMIKTTGVKEGLGEEVELMVIKSKPGKNVRYQSKKSHNDIQDNR
ncbi:MAG: hypothetical protein IKH97_09200 [Bacteroidales bacterium]|nr:hypothetical protein [Bacteroidales bacterium]